MQTNEHILLQELHDQPNAIRKTIDAEMSEIDRCARFLGRKRIHFFGMGSSYFASLYARYLLTALAHNATSSHLASEFIHYPSASPGSEVSIALSQSGESIETVKTVRLLKKKGNFVIVVTNEQESTLARLGDWIILTHAGKEKASSTKTFASTLAILYCLSAAVAARTKQISDAKKNTLVEGIMRMTRSMDVSLESWSADARSKSNKLVNSRAVMVLGRGPNLPSALQGALLLKEVAKIPAEGMSSGEFAHGPIEIVSKKVSVIILGGGRTSRLQCQLAIRSKALHAWTLMITPNQVQGMDSISYGENDEYLAVFACSAVLELLAYHTAVKKRINPDRFKVIQKVTTRE